jgi:ferredoxin
MSPRGGFGGGGGRGQGRGGGRGQGGGRGWGGGHGLGQGGGGGMRHGMDWSRGGNRSIGQGKGQGVSREAPSSPVVSPHFQPNPGHPDLEGLRPESQDEEIEILRARADTIITQLWTINLRISELQGGEVPAHTDVVNIDAPTKTSYENRGGRITAIVDEEECASCGICVRVCPEEAIIVNDIAVIDPLKCTGCGSCVDECPNRAISLAESKEVKSQREFGGQTRSL